MPTCVWWMTLFKCYPTSDTCISMHFKLITIEEKKLSVMILQIFTDFLLLCLLV